MWRSSGFTWLKRAAVGAALVAIAITWVNARTAALLANQNPAHPLIFDTYIYYHVMATGMREGRIGQVDLAEIERYAALHDPSAVYERPPRDVPRQWLNYYTLDVGYSFIVEAARLAFPGLPDNSLRALALQIVADAALVFLVFFLFSHWNLWLGLLAAYLYSSNVVFAQLASIAFYYFWDIPLTIVALGSIVLAMCRPSETTRWLTLAGFALGFGVWLRGSWWPLSLFLLAVAAGSPRLRARLVVPVIAFSLLAVPQIARASLARGQLTFTTRATWHVALVGLGYYPNPYGFVLKDTTIFQLTKEKYGVVFRADDYFLHDQAAKKEFLALWEKDRRFVIRSLLGRLEDSLAGTTESSALSFRFFSNPSYRLLCLAGFVAMMLRGGQQRLLAVASAGVHMTYVVLTAAFFYVGLAYSSVSEVTLFFLFMGGIEAILHAVGRMLDCEDRWLWAAG